MLNPVESQQCAEIEAGSEISESTNLLQHFFATFSIANFALLHQKMDQTNSLSQDGRDVEDEDTLQRLEASYDFKIDYKCSNCILEFAKNVIAYLNNKHFLIIDSGKIVPTPLGKAAFASSISPEESQSIFNDLLSARQ